MNEQAIIDSYNLAVQNGYKKSVDDFKQLLSSNQNALNDVYNLAVQNGYRKSVDDYKVLMGVSPMAERPVTQSPVDEVKKKEDTVSPFVDGGSGLTKFDPRSGQVVQDTPEFVTAKPEVKVPAQKLPELSQFGFQPGKGLPAQKTAPLPKFIEDQLQSITPDITGKTEETVVPQLEYQFGPLGFKFEEIDAGDFMKATSPSGESIRISLDITNSDAQKAETNKLNAFLRKGTSTLTNLSTLQKQYTDANKKITSQKELDDSIAKITEEEGGMRRTMNEMIGLREKLDTERGIIEKTPEASRNTPEYISRVNNYMSSAEQFEKDIQVLMQQGNSIEKRGVQLNKSIGKYTEMKAEQGTWFGAALNSFANKSYYNMAKGFTGLTIDFLGEILPEEALMSQDDYEKNFIDQAKKEGVKVPEGQDFITLTSTMDPTTIAKIENRVRDFSKKSVKKDMMKALGVTSDMMMVASGVSPEYYQSIEKTFVGGALLGALSSIPAMAGGPIARTTLMSSQVLSGLDEEMANDPAFADISENEKLLVKGPIAAAVGILENLGLSNLLNQKGFLNGLVLRALGKVGTGASYKTFGQVINNEVNNAFARGALTLGAGFLAEVETGALQEVADIGFKEIYNKAKEKEFFDTPDTVIKFIEQVGKAGLQEGIGAGVLAIPGSVSSAYTGKGFVGMSNDQFSLFEKMANDSSIEKAFITKLKNRINSGEITTSQGKDILNNYRNSVGLFNSLPENLDIDGKKEAMNLLKEKRDLERQIDGKDQALTVPQRNRVNQINQQLTSLSESAAKVGQPIYKVGGKDVSVAEINELINTKSKEELLAMNIQIENDTEGVTERFQAVVGTPAAEAITFTDADRARKQELEEGIASARARGITIGENLTNELETLNKKEQDAIQEQAAGQVPVQPGAGGSQEVQEGLTQAEPQVVTPESQAQEVETLRAQEQAELTEALTDAEQYMVDGKIDGEKITDPAEKKIFDDIYNEYDKLITPLIEGDVAVQEEVEFTEDEVNTLSDLLNKSEAEGKNLPEVFQLETTTDNEAKKKSLVESATKLIETVSDDMSSKSNQTNAPTMEPTPIVITENTELTNKVPRFPLIDLIKKRINLVMADQLKVGDGFMGGPLFPLIEGIFGKAAWASINLDAARKIVRGAINGDYSVVFNMNPTAVDSNTAFMDTFIKKLNDAGIKENVLVELKSYVKDKKFGKKTDQIRKITEESTTIDEFSERLSELDVDTISDFVKKIIPSKSVVAETAIGKILQSQNITQEDIRAEISEQLAKDLPMGAMTMVLKITDANGNPVTEKNIDDAIITPEQQKAEGIPSHRNYPFYVRGSAVGILDSTVPFWNMSKAAMSTINAKVAKVIRNSEGKAYSASQARAAAMRSASMKASKSFVTQAPTKSAYQQFIERLSKAIPSVEVVTSQKEFDDLLTNLNTKSLATKNQKIYGAVLDGKLYLNPSLENFNTPIHEFAHVWTNTIKELSPEIYKKGIELIKGSDYVSQIESSKDYKRITDKMRKDGATDQEIRDYILEEAMATAIGDKGESFATASQKRNFKNWLNDLFQFIKKLTGISKLTPEQVQNLNLDDFLNSVVVDLLSEKPIFKNAEVKNLSNQLQLMAMPDMKADDIVKIGLANGFSEGSIRELLKRRGFTQTEINSSMASTVQAAKKVEVTEEFAPGYNRVLNEIFGKDGVVAKSRRRGRTEDEAMQNAIDYLEQDAKVYENATDVQREAMVRNVRKEFKKREKAAPSAEKVVGKPKKKQVTVDEMAALKDQIRLEARAAREAKGDLNTKRKALAARIIAARKKGAITAAQARAMVNRISKVNLDNPIMVDRLIEYTDKVFDDANYAADMAEIIKLQKQARSRKHTSMTNLVNQFTSINPEDIPLDRIQDYKEALDFLNNNTPFYGNMNNIFGEITSYKTVEEFDAVKTRDALDEKYKSIELNKVKSVEEYIALIKDINSFKRKAFQLLQDDAITQEEYEELIDRVGKDQAAVEKKYEKEITQIKKDLIAEIKNQRPKVSSEFSDVENDLIRKYLELSEADLESLSPEELFILNDLLENISNGEIDYYRFSDIVSKAFSNDGIAPVTKQVEASKFNMGSERGRQELSEQESAFWEGLLGMGRAKVGALQKFIISPFNRAIGSFENFIRKSYNEFKNLKGKYDINNEQMHKIGILTTYLQEYMAQFDPKNKGVKDIGNRDWFKEILSDKSMRDKYSSGKPSILKMIGVGKSEIDIVQKIWDSLPKDKDGNVDPKAVYDSYIANDGKFFTKKEKAFFDDVMAYKTSNITPKQKAANELSGQSFKEVPFHMLRVRLKGGKNQIQPSAESENGVVRIKAGTGKERTSEKVGPVMTNFEKLFISSVEQTGRDYFLSGALKDINNILSGVRKNIGNDKMPLLDTISYALSDALKYEFDRTQSNFIFRNLLSARAAMTLLRPIRAAVELGSTLISYPVRAKTLSGYKSLFGEQGAMKKLLEFTDSPMLLRDNISKAIDINDGSIEPQGPFTKATNYLSGLPERTMMVTSWMPTFKSEFKNITGIDFDMKKFNESSLYREKYGKAIRQSSAVADAITEKIIGPTTKAGQRREVRIAPRFLANLVGAEGTVSKNTAAGQILGFFSNYPFRESTEFINGFREAAEVLKDEGALSSLSQLQKPLGVALNVAAYGFLSSATYALQLMLLGDDEDEKRGEDLLKALVTGEGLLDELKSNAISLAGSKYAAGGKAMIQLAVTILIESTDDEKLKAKYKKILKDSVFIDPLPVDKMIGFKGEEEFAGAIGRYIPQFTVAYARAFDLIGTINEVGVIYDKVEKNGVKSLTEDEGLKVLALNTLFNSTQIVLNLFGTSLPEYNSIKTYMKKLKQDAGVADAYKGGASDKKGSSGGGGGGGRAKAINKTDLKRYYPEEYNDLYGKNSPGYEIQQEIKAFEKEQRDLKKQIKDDVFGGKD